MMKIGSAWPFSLTSLTWVTSLTLAFSALAACRTPGLQTSRVRDADGAALTDMDLTLVGYVPARYFSSPAGLALTGQVIRPDAGSGTSPGGAADQTPVSPGEQPQPDNAGGTPEADQAQVDGAAATDTPSGNTGTDQSSESSDQSVTQGDSVTAARYIPAAVGIKNGVIAFVRAIEERDIEALSGQGRVIVLRSGPGRRLDVIYPGLINLHNHTKQNVLPLWAEAKGQFANRFDSPFARHRSDGRCRRLDKVYAA